MRKKMSVMMAVALLITTQLLAQSPGKISGAVTANNKPLRSVTVSLLLANDSTFVKADITDADGKYSVPVKKAGTYLLSFSLIGYEKKISKPYVMEEGAEIDAGTVSLDVKSNQLSGVTVLSKKPMIEVQADKTVFNVESSINATGSNALELLQKSPGIQVDNNDNISMKGKTGVRVYVDGKMMQLDTKDLAAYLKSINSNDIEAIEMISNPSAKYDASGNAGIINLRLKKNKKFGTNGSASLGFTQGVTPKGNGSLNLNYRDKKVNIFGNIGGNLANYENTLSLYRIQKDTLYDQNSVNTNSDKSVNIKAGVDYFVDNKNTIGVMATTNFNDNSFGSTGSTMIYYNPTATFIKSLQANNTIPGSRTNVNLNLNYRYVDTTGREINFDGDYGFFRGVGRSYQPNNYFDSNNDLWYTVVNRNYTPTDIDIYTAKIDLEQKLGKGKFGYGAKTSFVITKNTFDFFTDNVSGDPIKILDRSNSFKYTENVNAAYVNYRQQLNAKWSLQTGLRMEQTNSEGVLTRADGVTQADNTVKRSYWDFFPSAAVSWSINQKHSLSLTYSRRIDRPTYQDLNPFENKLDELTYQKGNAFLRPQYTNNVELTHTFMGFINTSVGYSHVKDYATEVTDTVKNATFLQQKNLATQQIINFNIGSPLPIKKWWNGYANFWYNYQIFNGAIGENKVQVEVPSYGAYMQHSFTLGKDYSAEISGWYNGPSIWGGTWRTRPQGGIDVGFQKLLLQKRATIKIAATDILYTAPWSSVNDFGGTYIKGKGSWESRTFRVNFSWRFGNSQVKSSRQRKTGLESEASRIKGGN
ncbi:TonB-dependent receptor [Ferruginibacter lapsinanis]|uniref:TonB-dependent receptor domain-containing protein n=1 Tax=Ferruginibacter lapsinanis TaxID=563172 RepID=UPI001E41A15A|nr:TonB-dependent receptor [Ferruginibacter lapsinanis]UEG49886.1 TonB-dependent receptor [Ferruginibacter lapsinanis]